MKKQDLEKLVRQVEQGGGRKDRKGLLAKAVSSLDDNVIGLKQEKLRIREFFHLSMAAWLRESISTELDPFVIKEDRRTTQLYRTGGGFCVLLEMGLAAWLSEKVGIPVWTGLIASALLPVILEAAFKFWLWNRERPRETLDKIRRKLLLPSFVLFGLAILFLLAYRVVPVNLAIVLEPAVSFGLWMATVGALFMAGSLFSAAHIYNWSYMDAREFRLVREEQEEANRQLAYFRVEQNELAGADNAERRTVTPVSSSRSNEPAAAVSAPQDRITAAVSAPQDGSAAAVSAPQDGSAPVVSAPQDGSAAAISRSRASDGSAAAASGSSAQDGSATIGMLIGLVLLALVSLSNSCDGKTDGAVQPRSTTAIAQKDTTQSEMDIYIDASKSPNDAALSEAARNIYNAIPEIVEHCNVVKLRVFEFGRDGFVPQEKRSFGIQPPEPPQEHSMRGEEPPLRADVEAAQKKQLQEELEKEKEVKLIQYRQRMKESLSSLSVETLLPSHASIEPRCTDVNGVLRRISQTKEPRAHIVLLITDGVQTCGTPLESVPAPASDVILVTVLSPERIGPRAPTSIGLTSSVTYERKAAELSRAVPWAVIVPQFKEDFISVFDDARRQRDALAKSDQH